MLLAERTKAIKLRAFELGFDDVRIAPADHADPNNYFLDWLQKGYAGTMEYMHKNQDVRRDPRLMVKDAKSVVVVALSYANPNYQPHPQGKIARYAVGTDYHRLIQKKLRKLRKKNMEIDPGARIHPSIDTSGVLEREWAKRSGLAWIGKSTMALSRTLGSYFFLGTLITTTEFIYDEPTTAHCGSCTRCIDACPPKAIEKPYLLNATRCTSYWNIEYRGEFGQETPDFDGWLFGCDICQEVCPWNKFAKPHTVKEFDPKPEWINVADILKAEHTDVPKNLTTLEESLDQTAAKRTGSELIRRNYAHLKNSSKNST